MKRSTLYLLGVAALAGSAHAQTVSTSSVYGSSEDFARYASKLRETAISQLEPQVFVPTTAPRGAFGRFPWKTGIVTTIFWVGESASTNNPVHNRSSSWDSDWSGSFGGFDNPDPSQRNAAYLPVGFVPKQNPFYVALPYNDVSLGHFKPEAPSVIPWFRQTFERDGKSVCRDRWIAVRKGSKTCYAQWSDCGPFRTDHWEYVFGRPDGTWDRPKPNLNKGAGLDVSPAVRDYLNLSSTDVTDWKFVEARDVPSGPWARFGDNNNVAALRGRSSQVLVNAATSPAAPPSNHPRQNPCAGCAPCLRPLSARFLPPYGPINTRSR